VCVHVNDILVNITLLSYTTFFACVYTVCKGHPSAIIATCCTGLYTGSLWQYACRVQIWQVKLHIFSQHWLANLIECQCVLTVADLGDFKVSTETPFWKCACPKLILLIVVWVIKLEQLMFIWLFYWQKALYFCVKIHEDTKKGHDLFFGTSVELETPFLDPAPLVKYGNGIYCRA